VESFIYKKPRCVEVKGSRDEKPLCILSIPYVSGISEMFKRISEGYKIRTVFETK
jgi:hypothetical protein